MQVGLIYLIILIFFAILAFASKSGNVAPLPFGKYLTQVAVLVDADYWVMFTTLLHFTTIYYSLLGIMKGYAAGTKQLMIVIYKTITPWAHSVALSNFLAGTLTTSLVRVIKDSSKIVSV